MPVLTYKYRLLPTRAQHAALVEILESQRQLYNAALQERIEAWRMKKIGRSLIDQQKSLTECRAVLPEMAALPANLQRATLKRLDIAFQGFFGRVKRGDTAGFPRFRGKGWFNSFGFVEFSGIKLDEKRLRFKGMPGGIRVHFHRALPDTKILSCNLRRDAKGWTVGFVVNVEASPKRTGNRRVGIDVGLADLVAFSDDSDPVPNIRAAKSAERAMKITQRALARCNRGSKRRQKAKSRLARLHAKIANTRETHLHQVSSRLVQRYDSIAVENLSIKNMSASASGTVESPGKSVAQKSGLNRSINDAAWGKLKFMLAYKAEKAGCEFVEVDPKYSSQTCACCGHVAKKNRVKKAFKCVSCGYTDDADTNAAKVISHRAVVGPAVAKVAHRSVL